MANTTLSVKVSAAFAEKFREFCEKNFLQIGKFAENALSETMEDYYFGRKAQAVLSEHKGKTTKHQAYFKE